ncbi:MAG: peptide-N-glycosidase F-related protein [Candidatus Neomarinimicrobiota bacterium]
MKKLTFYFVLIFNMQLFGDTTIVAFDAVHQSFGSLGNNRTIIDTILFPVSNSGYSEITMNVYLECPGGGCDPWDRKAKISIKNLNEWYEIGRYVTPYGVECGWTFNVTDYHSLLKGEVELRSYIDTWVQPGWLVTITFDFISGVPENLHTMVRNIWNNDYVVYGDSTNPVNIPSATEYLPIDATDAYLRLITTGHGQGNTDNAAEFSLKIHDIYLNGEFAFLHNFWRDDCSSNSCSPQNGSWQYQRAGFCPGDKVTPQDFNLLDLVLVGDTVKLDYVLEDYFNQCSPNNPSCTNGVTCSLCDYNNSGHTEPYYFIGSHLIIHTESYHTNADTYFMISNQDSETSALNIYLENYAPVYGIQFNISLDGIDGIDLGQLNFENGQGGRAEEFGWVFAVNDSGLVIGMAQGTGSPISGGEGLLTQIPWNINELGSASGSVSISNLNVSGYFGSEITYEIGPALNIASGLEIEENKLLPNNHKLYLAYPNPFNPIVNIPFSLSNNAYVELNVYSLNGLLVETLIDQVMDEGSHNIQWHAESHASGVYLYTLESDGYFDSKKMVIIK